MTTFTNPALLLTANELGQPNCGEWSLSSAAIRDILKRSEAAVQSYFALLAARTTGDAIMIVRRTDAGLVLEIATTIPADAERLPVATLPRWDERGIGNYADYIRKQLTARVVPPAPAPTEAELHTALDELDTYFHGRRTLADDMRDSAWTSAMETPCD